VSERRTDADLSLRRYKAKKIMATLGVGFSGNTIKEIFNFSEDVYDVLINEAYINDELDCVGGIYYFKLPIENMKPDTKKCEVILKEYIKPLYYHLFSQEFDFRAYRNIMKRMVTGTGYSETELHFFWLDVGDFAEQMKNTDLAINIYRFNASSSQELGIKHRKHIFVKSVLKLSRLEFMRGISTDNTLEFQRQALKYIDEVNLTSEDALLMLYAGMGEQFSGIVEEGELLREKGLKYMSQFNFQELESEAIPLVGWHYHLQGDFSKTISYYENFILAIENKSDNALITLAYPSVIFSYFYSGEYNKALALSDIIYRHALRDNDMLAATLIYAIMGRTYVYLRDYDSAEKILRDAYEQGKQLRYGWGMYYAVLGSCLLEYRRKNYEACRNCIVISRKISEEYRISPMYTSPFILDALQSIDEDGLNPIDGFSYDEVLQKHISSKNIHLKGVAYRHIAEKLRRNGEKESEILKTLRLSIQHLEMSGNTNELGRTYIAVAESYERMNDWEMAGKYAKNAWNHLTEEDREDYPESLLHYVQQQEINDKLGLELETSWLELRNIIGEERLSSRLLTSMSRVFATESGVFSIVKGNRVELRFVQNLDKSDMKSLEMQRIESILSQVASTGKIFVHIREKKQYDEHFIIDNEPLFCIAIPFKQNGSVRAALYLHSHFGEKQITQKDLDSIEKFAEKMSDSIISAIDYNLITDKAAIIDSFSEEKKEEKQYCESTDEDVLFIKERIAQVAKTAIPVLLIGETGVGKEVFARDIFRQSLYKKNFVKVNCGAIPENLIESELFGYEKGSFTGAVARKKGYFEIAEGGTIFLDEIGELPLAAQVKLLRILQEHEFMRVGGTENIKVNFRLIAATNKDLSYEVEKGTFRRDLYYRLNVVELMIPPLRDRKKDIPVLASFFIDKFCKEYDKEYCTIASDSFINMLNYAWPGNVRELENILQRAVLFSEDNVIHLEFQSEELNQPKAENNSVITDADKRKGFMTLEEMEKKHIQDAISLCGGKIGGKNGAAELLGLNRNTLNSKIRKYGIKIQK